MIAQNIFSRTLKLKSLNNISFSRSWTESLPTNFFHKCEFLNDDRWLSHVKKPKYERGRKVERAKRGFLFKARWIDVNISDFWTLRPFWHESIQREKMSINSVGFSWMQDHHGKQAKKEWKMSADTIWISHQSTVGKNCTLEVHTGAVTQFLS